jgi:hypothetical protein
MLLLLGLVVAAAPADSCGRTLAAHLTATAPVIDGILEDVWQTADSATGFTQLTPDFDSAATEPTTAYILYDHENVYVAFRCLAREVTAYLSSSSDGIRLFFDTFEDRTSCYQFIVDAAGCEQTYRLVENGQMNRVWDGVWRSSAKCHPWGYAVELAIPFKTLRYPPGKTTWGIDFGRYAVSRGEKNFWSRHHENGFRVERLGTLTGIEPPRPGLHLEVYPVGLVRADKSGSYRSGWRDSLSAAAGLDLSWLPTPTANIQLTALPDFAQIEADPYQVNLSRYELSLSERRPFFVEAAENFGTASQPIRLFYSRRIGKSLPDGTAVPIEAGGKYTDRIGRWQLGALGARTAGADYDYWGTPATEPASWYSVASLRRALFGNSEVGLLYAGKDNEALSNHGTSVDAALRFGDLTATITGAGSQLGDSLDWAGNASASYSSSTLSSYLILRHVGSKFNMNGPGYTAWRGRSLYAQVGPELYARGPFRYANANVYVNLSRDCDYVGNDPDWETGLSGYGMLRNRIGVGLWAGMNRGRYSDTAWHGYRGAFVGGSIGTSESKAVTFNAWGSYTTRSYNYNRGMLAPSADIGFYASARLSDRLLASADGEFVFEYPDSGALALRRDATTMLRPRLDLVITPKMTVGLGNEIVLGYDIGQDEPTRCYRLSALYSYTFLPRSTVYFAWNWNVGNDAPTELVQVLKVRYLFTF